MTILLALHGVVGLVLFSTGSRLGRRSFLIGAVPAVATLVWFAVQIGDVLDGGVITERVSWVPALDIAMELRLDGFAATMVLLVSGIGLAVFLYAAAYFPRHAEGLGRSAGLLTMFAGAMLCVVLADDLMVLYVGWELTSITSYLLIGNNHTQAHARAAALHALLVTSAGGLAMLAGFVLLGQRAGSYRLSDVLVVLAGSPSFDGTVIAGLVLVLVGAFTKSAQYPFHSWLPGAMAAPTPVSAYLHSATMVKAGVYLIGRFAPVAAAAGFWRPLVIGVGLTTMIAGGLRALRQRDLKLLLAFGTVSQLGFLVVLFGAGTPAATAAGCVMLLAHAVFKAALFMAVGTLDRHTGTRDLRELPALGPRWRPFVIVTLIPVASMAAIPLTFGFIGKEAAYDAIHEGMFSAGGLALAGIVAGSVLTFAYTARFAWGAFAPPSRRFRPTPGARPPAAAIAVRDHPDNGYVLPAAALAAVTMLLGVAPGLVDRLVSAAASSLDSATEPVHLAIWHGVNAPLVLSGVTLAAGYSLARAQRRIAPLLRAGSRIPTGTEVYLGLLRGLNVVADRVTGIVQNGSLPIYAGVTLLTAAVVPGFVLLTRTDWPGMPRVVSSPAQVPMAALLVGAALAAAVARRRFSAALFLGTAGYAMAGLFVVQGAPDLALTQVAIETLSTVMFVLVLRRLPDRFERTSTVMRRVVRMLISALVALAVFSFAVISRSAREAQPVSGEMIERSLPDGHGRNVVNVILVDIRGFDTLGEITVLASAAIGAVALARVGRRGKRDSEIAG
ncbi:MAG: hydrogen gas-evolving membrane-bound hydrogenase subunit E [Acidimicrobiia bacterium]